MTELKSLSIEHVSEKGPEGFVSRILKRGRTTVAGIISYVGKKDQLFAYIPYTGGEQIDAGPATQTKDTKVG